MSHTFTIANVDTALLAMDPRTQMLAQLRSGTAITPASTPPIPFPNEDDNMGTDSPVPPVQSFSFLPPPNNPLAAFGNLVKRPVKLSDKSLVVFDQLCHVRVLCADQFSPLITCCLESIP